VETSCQSRNYAEYAFLRAARSRKRPARDYEPMIVVSVWKIVHRSQLFTVERVSYSYNFIAITFPTTESYP
jgi:hypothetical protein